MARPAHVLSVASMVWLLAASPAMASLIAFSATGNAASDIQNAVDFFRTSLGDPNNANVAGPLGSGRREINWDGGGSTTSVNAGSLAAFLNIRGALMSTPGTGFVQAPISGLADPTVFNQPGYLTAFDVFSAQRLFSPIGSNVTDVTFFIPGTNGAVPATVAGFGAVFTDDDLPNISSLQFFDISNTLIGAISVPALAGSGSLSFAGGLFNAGERIFRVRIITGNAAPGVPDGPSDVVVMDDFFFSEPQVVPEPSSLLLVAIGIVGCLAYRRF